jgi:hypothetical protein
MDRLYSFGKRGAFCQHNKNILYILTILEIKLFFTMGMAYNLIYASWIGLGFLN